MVGGKEGTFSTHSVLRLGQTLFIPSLMMNNPFTYPVAQFDQDEGNAIGSGCLSRFLYSSCQVNLFYRHGNG